MPGKRKTRPIGPVSVNDPSGSAVLELSGAGAASSGGTLRASVRTSSLTVDRVAVGSQQGGVQR